jgi:predicted MFS family arabinose efflux permease
MEAGIGLGAYLSVFVYRNDPHLFPTTFYWTAGVTLLASVYLLFIHPNRQPQVIK